MEIEALIIYILQVVFLLLESYITYLLLKYLKQKPLGMQTLLDKVVKDAITCILFHQILGVFIIGLIVEFARPLKDDVAFIITTLFRFSTVSRFWTIFSVIMVRYVLVFYPTYLDIFDEIVTRRIIRCLVCIFSAIIVMADSTNNEKYYLLKGFDSLDIEKSPKFLTMLFIFLVIVLIITQYQIEKFKKSVDSQCFDNLKTIQDGQEGGERQRNQMDSNTYKTEIITGITLGLLNAFFQLLVYLRHGDLYLNSLRKTLLLQVTTVILVLMFICKNEKIHDYMKHRIQSLIYCPSFGIFQIHNDNSRIHAIYKPKYEVHDNINFHKNEEEIDIQCNEIQVKHESNVHEFSSIIFVKEYRKQEKVSNSTNSDQASVSSNADDENKWNDIDPMPGCSHWTEN